MRVECSTVAEFLEDLRTQVKESGIDCVLQHTVRTSICRNPVENNEVKFSVAFQASAVVSFPDGGGEYLLQLGMDMGNDYDDASQEKKGSEAAQKARRDIESFCKATGLRLGPGIIGL